MPSTTVHIPDKLLSKMDQIVKKKVSAETALSFRPANRH